MQGCIKKADFYSRRLKNNVSRHTISMSFKDSSKENRKILTQNRFLEEIYTEL